jgi:guanylate kinase
LELRLQLRGKMEPAEITRRLERGRAEVKEASWYDYLVINDNLETAISQLRAIVTASRCRTARVWPGLAPQFFPA